MASVKSRASCFDHFQCRNFLEISNRPCESDWAPVCAVVVLLHIAHQTAPLLNNPFVLRSSLAALRVTTFEGNVWKGMYTSMLLLSQPTVWLCEESWSMFTVQRLCCEVPSTFLHPVQGERLRCLARGRAYVWRIYFHQDSLLIFKEPWTAEQFADILAWKWSGQGTKQRSHTNKHFKRIDTELVSICIMWATKNLFSKFSVFSLHLNSGCTSWPSTNFPCAVGRLQTSPEPFWHVWQFCLKRRGEARHARSELVRAQSDWFLKSACQGTNARGDDGRVLSGTATVAL